MMSKIRKPILVFLFSFPLLLYSQTIEKKVDSIQARYDLIIKAVKDSAYKRTLIKFSCPDSTTFGHLAYYRKGSELKMIEFTTEGSHEEETRQYFIWDDKLILCYIQGEGWGFRFEGDVGQDTTGNDSIYRATTRSFREEGRYYFYKDKPIKCLSKAFRIHSSKENPPRFETTLDKEIDCDTEDIVMLYSQLIKLNPLEIKKNECPWEFLHRE